MNYGANLKKCKKKKVIQFLITKLKKSCKGRITINVVVAK